MRRALKSSWKRSKRRGANLTLTLDDGDASATTRNITVNVTAEPDDQLLMGAATQDTLTGNIGNDTIIGLSGTDTLSGGNGNDIIWGGMDDSTINSFNLTTLASAPNLKLWLDGNDLDGDGTAEGLSEAGLTGTAVGTWADKSGNNSPTQNGANKPIYTRAFSSYGYSVNFDGVDDLLQGTFATTFPNDDISFIVVAKDKGTTGGGIGGTISTSGYSGIYSSGSDYQLDGNGVSAGFTSDTINLNSNLLVGIYTQTNTSNSFIYADGILDENFTGAGVSISTATQFQIGGRTWSGLSARVFKGEIAEVLLYNTALSTTDRQALEYYLAEKWNLNVAGDNDHLSGGAGNDTLYGGTGNDTLDGGTDADTLIGEAGADSMAGGLGADVFRFTSTTDAGTGAAKDIIADFSQAQGDKIDLSTLGVTLSIHGTAAFTSLASFGQIHWAQSGSDTLIQIDTNGDTTADMEILLQNFTASTLSESDFLLPTTAITYTAAGAESVFGGAGNDSLTGSTAADTIYGWGGNDSLHGNIANDTLYGGKGNDTINGSNGKDYLDGGEGADTLTGSGHDDLFVFSGINHSTIIAPDLITDFTMAEDCLVLSGLGFNDFSDFEVFSYNGSITTLQDTDTGFAINFSGDVRTSVNAGTIFGIYLISGSGDETINGTIWNDYINGAAGSDVIYGGNGDDTIYGDSNSDTLYGGAGDDYLSGAGGAELLEGGEGADTMTGNAHADTFVFTNLMHSITANPDRITDFENGTDRIQLTGLGFTSLADFETLSHSGGITTLSDTQTNFTITFSGNVIAQLDNSDFIW